MPRGPRAHIDVYVAVHDLVPAAGPGGSWRAHTGGLPGPLALGLPAMRCCSIPARASRAPLAGVVGVLLGRRSGAAHTRAPLARRSRVARAGVWSGACLVGTPSMQTCS